VRVRFAAQAERELREIGAWIARDSPEHAVRFIKAIRQTARRIGDAPNGFPIVARYAARGIRRRAHGNYLLFFRVEASQVVILRIIHGARDYTALLDQEYGGQ